MTAWTKEDDGSFTRTDPTEGSFWRIDYALCPRGYRIWAYSWSFEFDSKPRIGRVAFKTAEEAMAHLDEVHPLHAPADESRPLSESEETFVEKSWQQFKGVRKAADWNSLTPAQQKYEREARDHFMGGTGDEVWD